MWSIEAYQSDLGEKAIKIILESWWSLSLRKLPQVKGIKTPDFELINRSGTVIAICEVKSSVDANVPTFDLLASHESVAESSRRRERGHRSKLERHHSKAMSQLDKHTNLPRLVVFMSFDTTDWIDMAMVLQEHQELYPTSPMADLYLLIKIHQGVIPSGTFEIKYTPQLMHTTKEGEEFGHTHLSLEEAWRNGGRLPATFRL